MTKFNPEEALIVSFARTPFGRFGGALRNLSGVELGAAAMDRALLRGNIDPAAVDAVYAGVGMIATAVLTPARQALLQSSAPPTTPSLTVDRACCSGMSAIGLAWKDIRLGLADVVLCGGFESLSNTPFLWPRQRGARPGNVEVRDPLLLRADFLDKAIAAYTGDEALRFGIGRRRQDEWALRSHQRYFAAQNDAYFEPERFPILGADGAELVEDKSPRANSSLEALARLKPVYGSPTVTAGNAPGLNDGAAFLVVVSGRYAQAHGLEPLARIVGYQQVSDGPTAGTSTPAFAVKKLLDGVGRGLADVALIEINEAFAATPLVSTLRLSDGDSRLAEALQERTNAHGGAIAIGHPLGASGARLVMTLVNGLRRRNGGLGAAAICGGYGQGDSVLVAVE